MPEISMTAFRETLQVGDVIGLKGAGVPKELESKFWRVTHSANGEAMLDGPYDDEAGTVRYRPARPRLRRRAT